MTVSQASNFNLQSFTDDGHILVGGRLHTYVNGTTTHKTAYTDAAGLVPHTYTSDGLGGQYIALNARGELPASTSLYLSMGAYDIALKTSTGATIWTRRAEAFNAEESVLTQLAGTGAGIGAAMVGYTSNATVKQALDVTYGSAVSTIGGLSGLIFAGQKAVYCAGYYEAGDGGGSWFKYDAAINKTMHDGATIISPSVPPIEQQAGATEYARHAAYIAGTGNTGGLGCYVRVFDDLCLMFFGAKKGTDYDSSIAFNAAVNFAAKNHLCLVMPDHIVKVLTAASVVGETTLFSTLKIRGTFKTTATRLGYIPSQCGSVIYTSNNVALKVYFDYFANENFDIRGVGFCDSSHYPNGTPNTLNAPIEIYKGRADGGAARYITGNVIEDVACNGYANGVKFKGVYTGVGAADLNYIGTTSFNRFYASNCGNGALAEDCTFNHLVFNQSVFFELTGQAFKLSQLTSGGNANATFNNCLFEGIYGILGTAGSLASRRNKFVFNSCNREFSGLYGGIGANGFYQGNPYGSVYNTDLIINSVMAGGLAYGEETLTTLDGNSTITSTESVSANISADSYSLTPATVNRAIKRFTVPANTTLEYALTGAPATNFNGDLTVSIGGGAGGHLTAKLSGNTSSTKYKTQGAALNSSYVVTVGNGVAGQVCAVSVGNFTALEISVLYDYESTSGMLSQWGA